MLRVGDLTLCRKVLGRRPGESLGRIMAVEVASVRREPLDAAIGPAVGAAEGVPAEHVWHDVTGCALCVEGTGE
jgi:hypothetical protein